MCIRHLVQSFQPISPKCVPVLCYVLRCVLVVFLFGAGILLFAASYVPFTHGIDIKLNALPLPLVDQYPKLYTALSPLRSVHSYGLFRRMTGVGGRPELIIQGSKDGFTWKDYVFPYKPQALDRTCPVNIPHQPRLDWQMWFAALAEPNSPWFFSLIHKLYYNSPSALSLFAGNPFPEEPPDYIRVQLYSYNFTVIDSHQWAKGRKKPGFWEDMWEMKGLPNNTWTRRYKKDWLPSLSYQNEDLLRVFGQLGLPKPAVQRKKSLIALHPLHYLPISPIILTVFAAHCLWRVLENTNK